MSYVVLRNKQDEIVRVFDTGSGSTSDGYRVFREVESGRLFVSPKYDFDTYEESDVVLLGDFKQSTDLIGKPLRLTDNLKLECLSDLSDVSIDDEVEEESSKTWFGSVTGSFLSALLLLLIFRMIPDPVIEVKEEVKQEVVKIIKAKPPAPVVRMKVPPSNRQVITSRPNKAVAPKKVVKKSVKRLGALSVLGSSSKSATSQKGGINLGQAVTSAGPGLGGGTQGSGGVQTSLYGKGILSAPVGVGGNVKGAGGYGTKGKGGGKAGYGKLQLTGSAGSSIVPLGREVIVGGGLEKDLISAVIRKNMGQIRFCYERGLQTNPRLQGRVTTAFSIGPDGRVKTARVKNSSVRSSQVEGCIISRIKSWKFPTPEGGVSVPVDFPFLLNKKGQS